MRPAQATDQDWAAAQIVPIWFTLGDYPHVLMPPVQQVEIWRILLKLKEFKHQWCGENKSSDV